MYDSWSIWLSIQYFLSLLFAPLHAMTHLHTQMRKYFISPKYALWFVIYDKSLV